MRNLPCAICRAQPRFRFASSRSRASPYRSLREPSAGSKLPSEGSRKSRHGSLPRRKKRPSHLRAKGECLAVPPFLMLLSRISQGSFNVDRTGRLTVKFSLPVQKLPSIPAFLQIPLSLSGISLWRCPGMYSSFSQPLFFFAIVCIIAEDFSFVKGEFRSLLLRNFLRLFH